MLDIALEVPLKPRQVYQELVSILLMLDIALEDGPIFHD